MTVLGISLDSVADQARFVEQEGLAYPLLSDPDGSVAAKYRVLGPGGRYALRTTFVIDEHGVIRAVDDEVQVDSHGDDLLALIAQLRE